MANHVLLALCILLAVGHLSIGLLVLNTKPDTIAPSLTSDLNINCSFLLNNQPNISSIISLIISKADSHNSEPGQFSDVISINAFANQVVGNENTNAVTSGNIDSNTLNAFLSLNWPSPSQAESGFYRCDANVIDNFGHPVDISTTAEVKYSQPDLDALIGIVGTLQADLSFVKSELAAQVQTVADQNLIIAGLQQDLLNKPNSTGDPQQEVLASGLQDAMFIKSQTHNGRHYLLSRLYVGGIELADYFCSRSQGYIVEIDDNSEYDFIVNFMNSLDFEPPNVMIGTTKDDQSGEWVFYHSGGRVNYSKWATGEPNSNNCAFLSNLGEMYDMGCDLYGTYTFLCEVPES